MTESDAFNLEGAPDYFCSKRLQEKTAFECADREEVELVSICPSVFIGPYYFRPSASLPTVTGYLFDPMKLTYPGGVNIIHVQDVDRAHFLLGEKGAPRERYLVCGDNMEWSEVHQMIAELRGLPEPKLRIGKKASFFGGIAMEIDSKLTGKPPLGTHDMAKMVGSYFWYNDQKAQELGHDGQGSTRRAIVDTIAWLLESPHLTPRQRQKLCPSTEVFAARKRFLSSATQPN